MFNSDNLNRLVGLYSLEYYLFNTVSPRFQADRTLTDYNFYAIVIWKSNRAKTKVQRGLAQAGISTAQLIARVDEALTEQAKVDVLCDVWGIGIPIASAILTVCYPDTFSVLDYRVWEVLKLEGVMDLPKRAPHNPESYVRFCTVCRALANEAGISLRDFDRALWAQSWEEDLLALIEA